MWNTGCRKTIADEWKFEEIAAVFWAGASSDVTRTSHDMKVT